MAAGVRDKLRSEVLSSYWEDLAPHQARGALLLLAPELDLLDAAEAMAHDDTARVSAGEAAQLEATEDLRFQFVVVQPWVLAQALR